MKLTVIGCSGSFPGPESAASCYLVEAAYEGRTFRLVMDLGNGALGPLQRHIDPLQVDAVLLTHLHADHCLDMCSYYVLRKYHPCGQLPRVPVYGPRDTPGRLARGYDLRDESAMWQQFDFHFWSDGDTVSIGPFTVTVAAVEHPVESFAIRLQNGRHSMVYSGDTGDSDALVKLAHETDLLLCEASFRESDANPPSLHLTGRQAAEHASRAGARRLVLTHIPPWYDRGDVLAEARPHFDGPVELAAVDASYDL